MHTLHYKSGILKQKTIEKEANVRARNQELLSSMQKTTKVDSVSIKSDSIKNGSIKSESIKSVDLTAKNDDNVGSSTDADPDNAELNISQVKAPFGDTKVFANGEKVGKQNVTISEKEVPINGQATLISGHKPVRVKGPFEEDTVDKQGSNFTIK